MNAVARTSAEQLRPRPPSPWGLVALLALIYGTLPFVVGDRYPLCRFAMFSHQSTEQTRLVARYADGSLRGVDGRGLTACQHRLGTGSILDRCASLASDLSAYEWAALLALDREAGRGGGGADDSVEVEVLRERVAFDSPLAPPSFERCVVTTCQARPLGGGHAP